MKAADISSLQKRLDHRFQRRELLEQALTHRSYASEARDSNGVPSAADNEQLEFLGDSVLGLVASEALFRRFPAFLEGELSKMRAHLVSAPALSRAAAKLRLGSYLRLGRGEEMSGGRKKPALLADAFEAVVAAHYLDAGMEPARDFVLRHLLEPELLRADKKGAGGLPLTDFKSALQEKVQGLGGPQPAYTLVKEHGPQHKKTFTVEARIQVPGSPRAAAQAWRAEGASKKAAEQGAARRALRYLERRPASKIQVSEPRTQVSEPREPAAAAATTPLPEAAGRGTMKRSPRKRGQVR